MGFINDILISVTSSVEVNTTTYTLTDADNNNTLVFTNAGGCKIEPYSGTPPDNFNVRIVNLSPQPIQIGFLTKISGGAEDYYETDGGDLYVEYFNSSLGWKTTGQVAVFDATLGNELAPAFTSGGTGYTVNADNPPTHEIVFGEDSMQFIASTTAQFMGIRITGILEIGTNYRITTVVTAQDGSSELYINSSTTNDVITDSLDTVPFTVDFEADNTNVDIFCIDNGCDITLSSISIKEIL